DHHDLHAFPTRRSSDLAGFYFWTNYQKDQAVTAQLDETTERFKGLLSRPLHPGGEGAKVNNIELVKEENIRLQRFLQDVRAGFRSEEHTSELQSRENLV